MTHCRPIRDNREPPATTSALGADFSPTVFTAITRDVCRRPGSEVALVICVKASDCLGVSLYWKP